MQPTVDSPTPIMNARVPNIRYSYSLRPKLYVTLEKNICPKLYVALQYQ